MSKSLNPGFQSGNHWVSCDRCGFNHRESYMRQEWNGLVVCRECYEPRHPQDLVRAKNDRIAATGLVRPDVKERFISVECTITEVPSAVVGVGIVGVAVVGSNGISICEDIIEQSTNVPQGTFNTNTL